MATRRDETAAIAAFIRKKGITRCPTVCLLPTQGRVSAADRADLQRRAETVEERRRIRAQRDVDILRGAPPTGAAIHPARACKPR